MPINEQQVRSIAQQEIQKNEVGSRFQVKPIQQHVHNNIDAPVTFQPILNYAGNVLAGDFGVTNPLPTLLPRGWSVSYVTAGPLTGAYQVTHNLNTLSYGVSPCASSENPATLSAVITNVELNPNNFLVLFYNTSGSLIDCGFSFVLTQINNKKQTIPTYVVSTA